MRAGLLTVIFCACSLVLGDETAVAARLPAELNELSFPSIGSSDEPWMVLFYTSWCHHCSNLRPIYDNLTVGGAKMGRLDCTHRASACSDMGLHTWPSVAVIRRGRLWRYSGNYTQESIEHWASSVLDNVEFDGAMSVVIPSVKEMVMARVQKQSELVLHDLELMWERNRASVYVIFATGVVFGILLAWLTGGSNKKHSRGGGGGKKKAKKE